MVFSMKQIQKLTQCIFCMAVMAVFLCLLSAHYASAIDDDVPFFAGQTALPNVMILFDNSDSMQDSPYKYPNGSPIRPNWYLRAAVIPTADDDSSCTAGPPCWKNYTYTAYRFKDEYGNTISTLTLPGQNPPNLPGMYSNSSTVTPTTTLPAEPEYHGVDCTPGDSSKKCSDKIYDDTVDWTKLTNGNAVADALFDRTYKNWKVAITEKDTGAVQYRTIIGRNSAAGYWIVASGDSTSDDEIEYSKGRSYMYALAVGQPGEVTKQSEKIHKDRVYDRNFNWNAVKADRDFDFMYKGATLSFITGTDSGESHTIIDRNTKEGYWIVDDDFSHPSDITSRYIIEADESFVNALESKTASGGNHPESKMYQAKQALKQFLLSDKIKASYKNPLTGEVSERYLLNVGFATFAQAIVPRTVAKYYRKISAKPPVMHTYPATFSYKYRYRYSHYTYSVVNNGCVDGTPPTSVTFSKWGNIYTNKHLGESIQRDWTAGNCSTPQVLCYKITNIICSPTDALPNRVLVQVGTDPAWGINGSCGTDPDGRHAWGATEYGWETINAPPGDTTCADNRPASPPPGADGWVTPGDACYETCEYTPAGSWTEPAKEAYYEVKWRETWGDLRQTNPDFPGYIDRDPNHEKGYVVTPFKGFVGASWTASLVPNPEPGPDKYGNIPDGDLTLVTTDVQGGANICLGLKSDGTCRYTGKILAEEPADNTSFSYPGINDDLNHPHGWSYKSTALDPVDRTKNKYRLKYNGSWLVPKSYFTNNDHFIYVFKTYYPSIWSDALQRPISTPPGLKSYYPALTGNDFSNYHGEDQGVFVNLPQYNLSLFNLGDDYEGDNIKRILNRVNLALQRQYNSESTLRTMAPGNPQSISVSTTSAQSGNGTPLAATLRDAKKYFESYIRKDPLSLNGCRKNFIILLTDGTETAGGDPADIAQKLWGLTVDGKPVPIRVFVVGFGLGADEKKALNDIAAKGGPADDEGNPATAYFANNVDELVRILAEDIASVVTAGSYNRSKAGLVKGLGEIEEGLTVYNAYFDYPGWRGHLEANDVYLEDEYDSSGILLHRAGEIKGPATHWAIGCSGLYPNLASLGSPDAGCIMAEDNNDPDNPSRTIYTIVDNSGSSTRVDFDKSTIDDATYGSLLRSALLPSSGMDIDGDGTANTDDDAKTIIGYTLHPGYDDGNYKGTRTAAWPLADIYDSSPVVVASPRIRGCLEKDVDGDGSVDKSDPAEWYWENMDGYCQYNYLHQSRDGVVYFGTNGGMIEAISTGRPAYVDDNGTPSDTSDDITLAMRNGGEELWGFIPDFVLPKLNEFRDGHRFTMDLSVVVADVDVSDGLSGDPVNDWKTILVAGQRQGGEGYIALDVTDPTNPQYLWSFHDDNLGQSWSRPSVARIEKSGTRMSVFIFGGGFSDDANKGNRIFIVKASDGTLLKEITIGGSTNNVPAQIKTMRYLTNGVGEVIDYRTKDIEVPYDDGKGVDSDRRDFIEVAYFGDTEGNIWRLEGLNSDSGEAWNPKVVKLYQPLPEHARPIYHVLYVVDREGGSSCNKRYILAGTGDENNPTGMKDGAGRPLINYFFEVEEDTSGSEVKDESMLGWRMSLGKRFPHDKYGFLLKPDGSGRYLSSDGKIILSSYIFILNIDEFDGTGTPWAIDIGDNLTYKELGATTSVLAALKNEYLFRDASGNLYEDPAKMNKVAAAGTYTIVDTSEWLTNRSGNFYDASSANAKVIIPSTDVDKYYYDNDGYWCNSDDPAVCATDSAKIKVDGQNVKIVQNMGEKMLVEPEGYGDQVYFMTYTPTGGCGSGTSFFYGINASQCALKLGGTGLLTHGPGTESYPETRKFFHNPQRKVGLGPGIGNFTLGGGTAFIGQKGELNALPIPVAQVSLKYWRQD